MPNLNREEFCDLVACERAETPEAVLAVPLAVRLLSDQLTPVLCYRRLVSPDERTAPSFLFESVEGGDRQGRYSILGARPIVEVVAYGNAVRVHDHAAGEVRESETANPLLVPRGLSDRVRLVHPVARSPREGLPSCPLGGWFGYASYDTVRYAEPGKLGFARAPEDDRGLPDMHFALYDGVVAFDHVAKLVHVVQLVFIKPTDDPVEAYDTGAAKLEGRVEEIQQHSKPLAAGRVGAEAPVTPMDSNITQAEHAQMVARAKDYIRAGDIFQVVVGQRFERQSSVDPFDVYRSLRAVNPSPYMVYLQAEGCILVASSPEILCRVRRVVARLSEPGEGVVARFSEPGEGVVARFSEPGEGVVARFSEPGEREDSGGAVLQTGLESYGEIDKAHGSESRATESRATESRTTLEITNRPLAGTRKRGATAEEDEALERELLADEKERAEHVMLVDLGRNDVGKVSVAGTVALPALMEIERYSHVMHISSTVTGTLRPGLDAWDALVATLPVGTISGAPKIRAMQIIDELEPVRRGPYGGGMGYVSLDGEMDIALALRTMVVPTAEGGTALRAVSGESEAHGSENRATKNRATKSRATWTYYIQAAGGIVADSHAEAEYFETVNKAAALARAVDLAESAFGR